MIVYTYGAPHVRSLHALLAAEEAVTLCASLGVVGLKAEGARGTPVTLLPLHIDLHSSTQRLLSQTHCGGGGTPTHLSKFKFCKAASLYLYHNLLAESNIFDV